MEINLPGRTNNIATVVAKFRDLIENSPELENESDIEYRRGGFETILKS